LRPGADRRRIGKFEQVSGGTLFLEKVGDMPPALQAKMQRLLQEQAFERVGGDETIRTDVRLIAATHRDLKTWSEEGKFRPDLYYRLGVFTIHLPPLRERGEDLPVLAQHYLRRYSRELGRDVRQVAPEAMTRLRGYSWPAPGARTRHAPRRSGRRRLGLNRLIQSRGASTGWLVVAADGAGELTEAEALLGQRSSLCG
jgi:transcriptional regulator with GAF, ATPase, and Fis domain